MNSITDLLDRDFSAPIEEVVRVSEDDPDTVFTELTEYIATDRIRAEYERLFSAMAAAPNAPKSSNGGCGVWISGFFGSGKSSFAKNLGYVLANRQVLGVRASSLFLKQMESKQVSEYVEFLNRSVPCEIFMFDVREEFQAQADDGIAGMMYRVLLRDPGYAEGDASPDTWPSAGDLVKKLFDLCEIRSPGKTFAFIVDEIEQCVAAGGEHLQNLCAVVGQFRRENLERMKAGKIPNPAWIVVTAHEKLQDVCDRNAASGLDLPELQNFFRHRIDLSSAGIGEVATRRVLRKKESQEPILRELFRDSGARLIENVRLEWCSRRTEFDEDEFVRSYPYLPHLIDLSIDIVANILRHPNATKTAGSRTIVRQFFEMIVSDRTRLADRPVGALVSIDKIYDLMEGNIPPEKQRDVLDISQHFDDDENYPGMAPRVAKAVCLMEFAGTNLPRTTKNIAALLIQRVTEAPPGDAVAAILNRMQKGQFVRETEDGWKLYDFEELRSAAAALDGLNNAIGTVNPRLPGLRNDLIQMAKKSLARAMAWYTRPVHEFNASVSRSLQEIVRALNHLSANTTTPDRLSANTAAIDRLAIDVAALERRLTRSEKRIAAPAEYMGEQLHSASIRVRETERTAYVIGLFGSGRRYINELMLRNIGERAKYFKDTIRLHPGPTPMIYSGHATMRHDSRLQYQPAVTSRILEAVGSGFADLIFVYRHPLDSLLTNWVWWRTYIHENRMIDSISQIYKNTDDLCADLKRHFSEFEAFAAGDPDFFAGLPSPHFLSFPEFVEETHLHLQSATLTLRLEDFMIDPLREFTRIVEVMSADADLSSLSVAAPRTKPYGYLAVRENIPRFRSFVDGLSEETKGRIEKMGYNFGS
jgi:hypothetical protein